MTLSNPCLTTTVTTGSITIAAITTGVGLTHTTVSYSQVADSAGTTYNLPNLCGTRTYSILDTDNSVVSGVGGWASVTIASGATTFTITISPNNDNLAGASARSMKLKTVLTDYNNKTGNTAFSLTINQYVCTAATTYTPAPAAMLTTKTHIIGDAAFEFVAPTFTTTLSGASYTCAESITYSLIK